MSPLKALYNKTHKSPKTQAQYTVPQEQDYVIVKISKRRKKR